MPTRDEEVGHDVLAKREDERREELMCRGACFFGVAYRDCTRNAGDGLILLPRQRRRNTVDNSVGMMDLIVLVLYLRRLCVVMID